MLGSPVRHVDDDRVRPADQRRAEALRGLVVKAPLPPVARHELGNDHERHRRWLARGHLGIEMVEVGKDRFDEDPHLGLDDVKRHVVEAAIPLVALRERGRAVVARP